MDSLKVTLELSWLAQTIRDVEQALIEHRPTNAMELLLQMRQAVDAFVDADARSKGIDAPTLTELMGEHREVLRITVRVSDNHLGVEHYSPSGMYNMRQIGEAFGAAIQSTTAYAKGVSETLAKTDSVASVQFILGLISGHCKTKEPPVDGSSDIFGIIK